MLEVGAITHVGSGGCLGLFATEVVVWLPGFVAGCGPMFYCSYIYIYMVLSLYIQSLMVHVHM